MKQQITYVTYAADMMRLFAEENNVHEVIWDVDRTNGEMLQGHLFYDLGYPVRVTNANGYMKLPVDGKIYCFVDGIQEEKFGRLLSFFRLWDLLEFNGDIIHDMEVVRRYSSKGLAERKKIGIAVKQSLQSVEIMNFSLKFDVTMYPHLIDEGITRKIIREVQNARKELAMPLKNKIILTLPSWPKEYIEYIQKKTLAKQMIKGKKLSIKKS